MTMFFADAVPLFEDVDDASALGDGVIIASLMSIGIFVIIFLILRISRKRIDKD